jgi:hypothetical protein
MAIYTMKISGWELNGSAHSLTNEETDHLLDYQEEMGIDDLSEIGQDLEDVIEGYYPFDGNMWNISKPLDISDNTWITIEDEEGNHVLETKLGNIQSIDDVDEFHHFDTPLNAYPMEGSNENILLFLEENKGLVCNFEIVSSEVPTIEDLSYESSCIETPDGDWDFVNKMFFKGAELDMEFDDQWVRGKALTVELWTLEDVE